MIKAGFLDMLIMSSLGMIFIGLWWAWPPSALIVVGVLGLIIFSCVRITLGGGGREE